MSGYQTDVPQTARLHPTVFSLKACTMARLTTLVLVGLTMLAGLGRATDADAGAPSPGQNFTVSSPEIAMIWVAPGTFLMSSTHGPDDDTWVTLTRGYWLGRTEVTQGQWQAVMESFPLPSRFKGSDRPVENIHWDLAQEFCAKVTARERTAGRLPPGYTYTLPTEAQWEHACRAGTSGSYADKPEAMGWYDTNSGGETHAVAQKKPNAWGFYDMHGNVWEWCADWYGGYPGGTVTDPAGATVGQFRVIRGGCYSLAAGSARSAFRGWTKPLASNVTLGFRLALAPERKEK
jgi:formylglycine-generating enzyme required for sulfatase activity